MPDDEQDYIDDQMIDDGLSDGDMAAEECGRWRNGKLHKHCSKAGSEECDWICPLNGVRG